MGNCDFCERETSNLVAYTDTSDTLYHICEKCNESINDGKCIRCNTSTKLSYKGLCSNCLQLNIIKRAAIQDEEDNYIDDESSELRDDFFYDWMVGSNKKVSTDDIMLIRIWVVVKLLISGISDPGIIADNTSDLEELARQNIGKVTKDCKIVIGKNINSKVISKVNNVYLIEA